MKRNLPPLNALKAFEATARHSSFTKAGEELNVTHTSVARHVRNLEAWLKAPLVHKTGRNIELTYQGKEFHAEIERIFNRIEHVTDQVMSSSDRVVRASVEPFFTHQWLGQKLFEAGDAISNEHFELVIEPSASIVDMPNSDFDLAIRFVSNANQTDDMHIFCQEPMYPFASSALFEEDDPPEKKLEALFSIDLLYSYRPEWWELWFRQANLSFPPKSKFYKQMDFRLGLLAVLTGKAAMVSTTTILQDELTGGFLRRVSDVGIDTGGFALIVSERSQQRPAVQKALEFLKPLLASYAKQ